MSHAGLQPTGALGGGRRALSVPAKGVKHALTRIRCRRGRHPSAHHLPRVRIQEGRGDAARCLPALLPVCGLRCAATAAERRLLRVLLVLGSALPADAGCLGLAERAAFGLKPRLVLGPDWGVEPSRDVPAERTAKGAALTDALRRAAAAKAGRVVDASDEAHEPPPGLVCDFENTRASVRSANLGCPSRRMTAQ